MAGDPSTAGNPEQNAGVFRAETGGSDELGPEAGNTDEFGPEEGGTDVLGPEEGGTDEFGPEQAARTCWARRAESRGRFRSSSPVALRPW